MPSKESLGVTGILILMVGLSVLTWLYFTNLVN